MWLIAYHCIKFVIQHSVHCYLVSLAVTKNTSEFLFYKTKYLYSNVVYLISMTYMCMTRQSGHAFLEMFKNKKQNGTFQTIVMNKVPMIIKRCMFESLKPPSPNTDTILGLARGSTVLFQRVLGSFNCCQVHTIQSQLSVTLFLSIILSKQTTGFKTYVTTLHCLCI